MKKEPPALVEKYFHSFVNGIRTWQGQVIQQVTSEVYLVQLFEWLEGQQTDQVLVTLSTMVAQEWRFYDTQKDWIYWAEIYRGASPREAEESYKTTKVVEKFLND